MWWCSQQTPACPLAVSSLTSPYLADSQSSPLRHQPPVPAWNCAFYCSQFVIETPAESRLAQEKTNYTRSRLEMPPFVEKLEKPDKSRAQWLIAKWRIGSLSKTIMQEEEHPEVPGKRIPLQRLRGERTTILQSCDDNHCRQWRLEVDWKPAGWWRGCDSAAQRSRPSDGDVEAAQLPGRDQERLRQRGGGNQQEELGGRQRPRQLVGVRTSRAGEDRETRRARSVLGVRSWRGINQSMRLCRDDFFFSNSKLK